MDALALVALMAVLLKVSEVTLQAAKPRTGVSPNGVEFFLVLLTFVLWVYAGICGWDAYWIAVSG